MQKIAWKNWTFAGVLTLPALLFFTLIFCGRGDKMVATGFTQDDNVSYVAYAKQYIDEPSLSLFYSNPLSDGPKEKIYFQPQLFIVALLLATGITPGFCLVIFCLIFVYISFLLLILVYDQFVTTIKFRKLSIILLAWGGGILSLSGIILSFFKSSLTLNPDAAIPADIWDWMFVIDPAQGWWGLNFGRSLLFSMESFYHVCFLLVIYSVIKKKWKVSIIISLILSFAHPFTGLELLLIVTAWSWTEKLFSDKTIPYFVPIIFTILTGLHIWYYLLHLMQFPEHAIVYKQYSLNWRLRYFNALPAYCIGGFLMIVSFMVYRFRTRWQNRAFRLVCIWAIIVFLLINHEWMTEPRQPIHFSRGYFYTSLFILGIPGLHFVIDYLNNKRRWILYFFIMIVLSDNILWLTKIGKSKNNNSNVRCISEEELKVLNWINDHSSANSLIISSTDLLPYLSTVYTKAYALTPHPYTTPFVERKRQEFNSFIDTRRVPSNWRGKDIIWIINKQDSIKRSDLGINKYVHEYQTTNYLIVRVRDDSKP